MGGARPCEHCGRPSNSPAAGAIIEDLTKAYFSLGEKIQELREAEDLSRAKWITEQLSTIFLECSELLTKLEDSVDHLANTSSPETPQPNTTTKRRAAAEVLQLLSFSGVPALRPLKDEALKRDWAAELEAPLSAISRVFGGVTAAAAFIGSYFGLHPSMTLGGISGLALYVELEGLMEGEGLAERLLFGGGAGPVF